MLTDREFDQWCGQRNLPIAAIEIIRDIRNSPPSRRVGGGRENVSGVYPSRKMKVTIQFESHTVEFPLVYQLENDDDVLEYYCQPGVINLHYPGPTGRSTVARHTADYFVLRRHGAGWVECKAEEQLLLLAEKSPNRYRLVNGWWECPPGKSYAEPLSLSYDLHSSAYISSIFIRNAQFLDDYLRCDQPIPDASVAVVIDFLSKNPVATLADLLSETRGIVPPDEIYQMVASSVIFIDWNAALLVEPEGVHLFEDQAIAEQFAAAKVNKVEVGLVDIVPGAQLIWDSKPWSVLNFGNNIIALLGEDKKFIELPIQAFESLLKTGGIRKQPGAEHQSYEHPEVHNRLVEASAQDLSRATKRAAQVQEYLGTGTKKLTRDMPRTLRRNVSKYVRGQEHYGNGFINLITLAGKQGNRKPRLDDETRLAMRQSIEEDYESLQQRTISACWAKLRAQCIEAGIRCPSYKTYCLAVAKRPRYEQIMKRKGSRAAYKHKEFYFYLDQQTPRHGDRPLEIGHIDHTEIDLELRHPKTGKNLGRAWFTFMTDAFSRKMLACSLSFDPPSYRSCMKVLRECVRRHGRLPQIIVIDGGHEFASIDFDGVLSWCEVIKKTRPGAKPRFGSVCERLFGTTNTQFLHNLQGNTQHTKDVRQVTVSNNPKNLAVWDLASLADRLEQYLFEVYDTNEHPALGQSPREAFDQGLAATGARAHRYIPYDGDFLMLTAPSTRKGTAKVYPGRGVQIDHFYFWCEAFRDPAIENQQVPVKTDPDNAGVAYAYVRKSWMVCYSQHYADMKGRSVKEVKIATAQLRQQKHLHPQRRLTVNASQIARLLKSAEQDEELMLQRYRDLERRQAEHRTNYMERGMPTEANNPEVARTDTEIDRPKKIKLYGAL